MRRVPSRVPHVLFALFLAALVTATAAQAAILVGVDQGGPADPPPVLGPPALPRVAEVLIDFETPAPCVFASTLPLRDEYLGLGVRFFGPDPNSGGAILDACGNFEVTGYSGSKFLAWNAQAQSVYSTGGTPALPERLVFSAPVAAVTANVGSKFNEASPVTLRAFGNGNVLVASSTVILTSALSPISVSAPGIVSVELVGPPILVLDDLRFTPGGVVAAAARSWGRLKAMYR